MLAEWLKPHWQRFYQQLSQDQLPHAFILLGPEGVGKRSLAEQMIRSALCQQPSAEQPACGVCRNCQLSQAGSHPDMMQAVLEDDAKQIKVDQIRELSRKATLTSSVSRRQVFLVDPADSMNTNASNAFLKTLEEPRADTLIVLVAESKNRLPITILSRCQQISIAIPPADQAERWLEVAAPKVSAEQRSFALSASGGAPGQALVFLDNPELLDDYRQTLREVKQICHGRGDATAIAKRWADEGMARRLAWLNHAVRQESWQRLGVDCQAFGLTGSAQTASLMALCRQADAVRALSTTTLKPELMLEKLLIHWQHGEAEL